MEVFFYAGFARDFAEVFEKSPKKSGNHHPHPFILFLKEKVRKTKIKNLNSTSR